MLDPAFWDQLTPQSLTDSSDDLMFEANLDPRTSITQLGNMVSFLQHDA
jgi:hypothetical protein